MDHMILPSEYLIVKDKLIKFQTMEMMIESGTRKSCLKSLRTYYDSLPEDEQVLLIAHKPGLMSLKVKMQGLAMLCDEYFEQVKIGKTTR